MTRRVFATKSISLRQRDCSSNDEFSQGPFLTGSNFPLVLLPLGREAAWDGEPILPCAMTFWGLGVCVGYTETVPISSKSLRPKMLLLCFGLSQTRA